TVPNTGSSTGEPSWAVWLTAWPALRAFTPPTMFVPAFSISAVCLVPSPPVMPWTMTLESAFKKIDMSLAPLLRRGRELGRLVGTFVHRVGRRDQRVGRVGEDLAARLDVVAVEPDDQRLG